jgi:tRNA(Ile)-lysidine synthase TilS/MesJ
MRFEPNYAKWFASDVLRAIRRYGLIAPGERVAVALSGGRDSVALVWIMEYLRRYSSLGCELAAVHVKTAEYDTACLRDFCAALDLPYLETMIEGLPNEPGPRVCSVCARLKRGAMASLLKPQGFTKLAFGHHADDVAETFAMNLIENRRLGSFCPSVTVPDSPISLIRPLVYVPGATLASLHARQNLPLLDYSCPHADFNRRARYRQELARLATSVPDLSRRLVAALENPDERNQWPTLMAGPDQI